MLNRFSLQLELINSILSQGEIHETLQICKSLTKRQIQYFNNVGCHGFEFATPYRALPSFVNDPLRYLSFLQYHFYITDFLLNVRIKTCITILVTRRSNWQMTPKYFSLLLAQLHNLFHYFFNSNVMVLQQMNSSCMLVIEHPQWMLTWIQLAKIFGVIKYL
jgi:hypothetical protein